MDHGAIAHQASTQQQILAVILLQNHSTAAGTQVEHKGHTGIGVVDQVAVAVAAADEDGVDLVVSDQHILGDLHGGNAGAATVLHIDAPSVLGADAVLHIAGRGGQGVFLVFLGDTQDHIDLHGIDAGVLQALQCGQGAHFLGAIAGLVGGNIFLVDAQLGADSILTPNAAGGVGDFLCSHNFLGQVGTQTHDTNIDRHSRLLLSVNRTVVRMWQSPQGKERTTKEGKTGGDCHAGRAGTFAEFDQ